MPNDAPLIWLYREQWYAMMERERQAIRNHFWSTHVRNTPDVQQTPDARSGDDEHGQERGTALDRLPVL
jgi:hypothetical protein